MGPVRQNPIQRTVSLFICVCIALCTTVAHNIAQKRHDSFPLTLQTITTVPMMSIWGKGDPHPQKSSNWDQSRKSVWLWLRNPGHLPLPLLAITLQILYSKYTSVLIKQPDINAMENIRNVTNTHLKNSNGPKTEPCGTPHFSTHLRYSNRYWYKLLNIFPPACTSTVSVKFV